MKSKKLQVMHAAEKLFIEKGYTDTSIKDVLEASGISKGTFYNYFSSKNELMIMIYQNYISNHIEKRDAILVGQDPANLDVFSMQLEVYFKILKSKGVASLYEELVNNPDFDYKRLIIKSRIEIAKWIEGRLLDIFGEENRDYLYDIALLLHGQIIYLLKLSFGQPQLSLEVKDIIHFCVSRLPSMIDASAKLKTKLVDSSRIIPREITEQCECEKIKGSIVQSVDILLKKNDLLKEGGFYEALLFVKEEVKSETQPRIFLLVSVLSALKNGSNLKIDGALDKLLCDVDRLKEIAK